MKKMRLFLGLITSIVILASIAFAQVSGVPRFKKGESYKSVRVKLIKAGWKPYHRKGADICDKGDKRCIGRPEMSACSGAGLGNCEFLWKRKGKTLAIFTIGEEAVYDGKEFQK